MTRRDAQWDPAALRAEAARLRALLPGLPTDADSLEAFAHLLEIVTEGYGKEGVQLLRMLSGGHPELVTGAMMDTLEATLGPTRPE